MRKTERESDRGVIKLKGHILHTWIALSNLFVFCMNCFHPSVESLLFFSISSPSVLSFPLFEAPFTLLCLILLQSAFSQPHSNCCPWFETDFFGAIFGMAESLECTCYVMPWVKSLLLRKGTSAMTVKNHLRSRCWGVCRFTHQLLWTLCKSCVRRLDGFYRPKFPVLGAFFFFHLCATSK